jgi:hypothetical protein
MDTDLVLTIGIVLFVLTVPSLLSAWVEGRAPRVGAIILFIAIALIVTANLYHPNGYQIDAVPGVMLAVFARALP